MHVSSQIIGRNLALTNAITINIFITIISNIVIICICLIRIFGIYTIVTLITNTIIIFIPLIRIECLIAIVLCKV